MRPNSSNLTRWIAIFSLLLSNGLTLTHQHADHDCCAVEHSHSHSVTAPIAGLESLPQGDCECTDCPTQHEHNHSHSPADDHDHDSCLVCRMVYEHAVETIEFTLVETDEPSFDFIVQVVQAQKLDIVSGYLTRGPPSPIA